MLITANYHIQGRQNSMKTNKILIAAAAFAGVAVTSAVIVGVANWNRGAGGTLSEARLSGSLGEPLGAATLSEPAKASEHRLGGAVRNLKKTELETDFISLDWDDVFGIDKYYVYLSDADSDDFTLVKTVGESEVTIDDLKSAHVYNDKVTTSQEREGGAMNLPAASITAFTRPKPVTGLTKTHSSKTNEFKWKQSKSADGYRIYRSADGDEYELISEIDKNKTVSFADKDVEQGTFYGYRVCAVRSVDGESLESSPAELTFVSGLCAPEGFKAEIKDTNITLSWKKNAQATSYNIYRSNKEDKDFELAASTDKTKYTFEKQKRGVKYYYRLEPVSEAEGRETVTGTIAKTVTRIPTQSELKAKVTSRAGIASGTYIEISIAQQHLWFYEDNVLVLDTDVVTGNNDGSHNTPTGHFAIDSRATDTTLTGPGYSSFVNYWMGFYGGCGIHDSSWRSSYGGSIYQGNGSHGCVNTPYSKVKIIYERTDWGTPVIVY